MRTRTNVGMASERENNSLVGGEGVYTDNGTTTENNGEEDSVDDNDDDEIKLTYREALTANAFNQLERLKKRIDRQQREDRANRNRQYIRVNEGMK